MNRRHTTTRDAVVRKTWWICAAWAIAVAGAGEVAAQDRDPFGGAAGVGDSVSVSRGEGEPSMEGVEVSEYLTVDLHVHDEDLANVLQMLSIQSERNIVMSSDVSATVTADLYDVTFYEALEAILNVNGYGYIERGNFIHVYTLEDIAQIEEASRVPVSKVLRLDYLNANDAAEFVTPLLSEIGQIKTNGDVDTFTIPDDAPVGAEEFALTATMVVFDYPEHVEEIEKLVTQLDTRPAQVLVEATILETQLTEANAFGVDFSVIADVEFTDFTAGPLSVANALIGGANATNGVAPEDNNAVSIASTPGGTEQAGSFKLGIIQDDFSLFVRLLDEVSDTTIISNPKLLTLNRQPARVLVGKRLGFLNTSSTETSTTQTVEFLDTGTQLRFRPFVSNDGFIRMELNPSVSEGVIRTASDASGANVSIPDEITSELTTNVLVRDGHTVVLGGLFKERTQLSRTQVPVAGDLPLIGAAFRGHDDSTNRSEIIFMIRPTIVRDDVLLSEGEAAREYVDRIRTGTRSGLLPWSRERLTAKLNLDAERLAAEGETTEALWKLRRSLQLSPVQPEAVRLRDRLLGETDYAPSRSVMDMILEDMLEREQSSAPPVDPQSTLDDESDRAVQNGQTVSDVEQDQPGEPVASSDAGDEASSQGPAPADAEDEALQPGAAMAGGALQDGSQERAGRRTTIGGEQPDPKVTEFSDLALTATVVPPLRPGQMSGSNSAYEDVPSSPPLLIAPFELADPSFSPMPMVMAPMTALEDDSVVGVETVKDDEPSLTSNQEMEPIDVAIAPDPEQPQSLDGPGFTIAGFWTGLRVALGGADNGDDQADAIVEVETDDDR